MKVIAMKQSEGGAMDTGISQEASQKIAAELCNVLADSYLLLLKTHYYHWNVTGPHFQALHTMFELQYNALFLAVDEVAERIRSLGFVAPGTYREYAALSAVKEDEALPEGWQVMVKNLVEAHEALIRRLRAAIPVAVEGSDDTTADLLTGRLAEHEKTAWMLRSTLG